MSFTKESNEKVFEISGKKILIKNTEKISEADLKLLSELVEGWTFCDRNSTKNACSTRAHSFPNELAYQKKLNDLIDKYNY